jgi:hypothetical protein
MLSPGPSNANLVQPHNGTLTRQSPDPIYQSPLNFPLSSAPASDYHGGQLEEWFPLPQNAGMDRHNQAIPVHIGTVTESTMNLNIGQDPPNFQDHGPSIPLLDSQIFLESSNLRSIQSPENQNLYTTPTLPSTTTQAARTNAARFVITDNDLEIDIRAIRQYINSGQEEEGTRIFLDLIGRIHKRVPPEVTSASEVVFRNESLTAETAIARFEATISQRQREYGFEHPLTQGTILSFANFILCLVEDDIRGQDMELLVTGNKLDRAASMLESSLSISFDNDVVRRLVQRDYSKEGLTIEFFEILVTQCAQRPFLLDAIPLSFRYSDLNAEYSIHVTLDIMVMTGELIKEIVSILFLYSWEIFDSANRTTTVRRCIAWPGGLHYEGGIASVIPDN